MERLVYVAWNLFIIVALLCATVIGIAMTLTMLITSPATARLFA